MTLSQKSIEIRKLSEADAEALWHLRLHALESEPSAFGESVDQHRRTGFDKYVSRLGSGTPDNFVLGAFEGTQLAGMTGFYRAQGIKERHKGHLWGVFVHQCLRGQGVGAALISGVLERARAIPGLEQVQLAVATCRPGARRLYASFGFRPFGLEQQALKLDDGYVDEEHMVLFL